LLLQKHFKTQLCRQPNQQIHQYVVSSPEIAHLAMPASSVDFQSLQVQVKSPTGTGAESPTTVRPLDMDDDDVQETGALSGDAPTSTSGHGTGVAEEAAPPKPPRPISEQQQNEITLREAFPTIDVAVVKAVLIASGGRVEPAFNALLGM
jgi:hypothetical protein